MQKDLVISAVSGVLIAVSPLTPNNKIAICVAAGIATAAAVFGWRRYTRTSRYLADRTIGFLMT